MDVYETFDKRSNRLGSTNYMRMQFKSRTSDFQPENDGAVPSFRTYLLRWREQIRRRSSKPLYVGAIPTRSTLLIGLQNITAGVLERAIYIDAFPEGYRSHVTQTYIIYYPRTCARKAVRKTQAYSSQGAKREIHIVFVRLNGVKTVKMKLEVAIMRTYCETEIIIERLFS